MHLGIVSERWVLQLVKEAHRWGLTVGVDATFTQTQEHGWRVWNQQLATEEQNWSLIKSRLDWLLEAGFDSVSYAMHSSMID